MKQPGSGRERPVGDTVHDGTPQVTAPADAAAKDNLKEGRALRTETTINQPRDLGIGKELTNLAALAKAGYAANRRLLDAECISHDPAAGTAALEMLTSPVISTTCTRVPGIRFPDPRVQALLAACCALALRPAGFTSRDLRHLLAPQLGKYPGDMSGGQISYDLRRLRAHQIIERIPHSRTYQVTADGLPRRPVLHPADQTRPHPRTRRNRRHRPAARQPAPPGRPRLQGGNRRPRRPGLTRHPATTVTKPLTSGTSRNTQRRSTGGGCQVPLGYMAGRSVSPVRCAFASGWVRSGRGDACWFAQVRRFCGQCPWLSVGWAA